MINYKKFLNDREQVKSFYTKRELQEIKSKLNDLCNGAPATAPAITSFTPTTGKAGEVITLTGTDFTGTTFVKFGGVNAQSFTVVSPTQITAVPASGGATGSVSIGTPGGTASLPGFTYRFAPTLTGFTPTSGTLGDIIVLTGTNFADVNTVTFGGVPASFVVETSTQITATLDASVTGDVVVNAYAGSATLSGFTYTPPLAKITVYNAENGGLLYGTDSIDALKTYLSGASIFSRIDVVFNTNDVHQPTTGDWQLNYSNGIKLFTVKSAPGKRATIDGRQLANQVVILNMSNIVWDGVDVINGFTSDDELGGTNIRLAGNQTGVVIQNCKIKSGYVGIRGTTNIVGLNITNVVIEEVNAGSIRLGTGFFTPGSKYEDFTERVSGDYDMRNVTLTNITCKDTLAGGNVPGTTNKFSPLIIIKMTENLEINNSVHTGNGAMVYIETSYNVLLDRIKAVDCNNYGIALTGCDLVTISNSFVKTIGTANHTIAYFDTVKRLSLIHNTFHGASQLDTINTNRLQVVNKIVGNVFKFDYYEALYLAITPDINGTPYVATVAQDFKEEHDNVFCNNNQYNDLFVIARVLAGSDLRIRANNFNGTTILSPAQYRAAYSGYGVNSLILDDASVAFSSRTNPDTTTSDPYYLSPGTPGRNMIASSLSILTTLDREGYIRTFPTDAGAYDRDATA